MLKELSLAALTTLNMNIQNATFHDYSTAIKNMQSEKSTLFSKNDGLHLPKEKKAELQELANETLLTWKELERFNKVMLQNNFDRWIVEESEDLGNLIDKIVSDMQLSIRFFTKTAKQFSSYPSISKKLEEVVAISKNIYNFTRPFQERTNKVKEALAFANEFIPKNEEALEILG